MEHLTLFLLTQQKDNIVAFFDLYEPLLNPGGVIISDNVMYHGLVTTKEKIEKQTYTWFNPSY